MSRPRKPTRAEIRHERQQRPPLDEGVYGVDAQDAGAGSWIGCYVMWARNPEKAKQRIVAANFHKRQIRGAITPDEPPSQGLPRDLGPDDRSWYRSRLDDSGWTVWEALGEAYRHPPQGLAAIDPSVR